MESGPESVAICITIASFSDAATEIVTQSCSPVCEVWDRRVGFVSGTWPATHATPTAGISDHWRRCITTMRHRRTGARLCNILVKPVSTFAEPHLVIVAL